MQQMQNGSKKNFNIIAAIFLYFIIIVFSMQPPCSAASLEKIEFFSNFTQRNQPVNVILPTDYNADHSYPAVYLLHGVGGNETDWVEATDILAYAAFYNFLLVMPDAEKSWYVDSPVVPESQYESYLVRELVPFIDANYSTAGDLYRGITGVSMGGHGAILLALRQPKVFTAASSLSGALEITSHPQWGDIWGLDSLLGVFEANPDIWENFSCYDLIQTHRPRQKLFFDCGDADPYILEDNRHFALRCDSMGVAYDYQEYSGAHKWTFWDLRIQEHLSFHAANVLKADVKNNVDRPEIKSSAFPNPFNSHVTIDIKLPSSTTKVYIFNLQGRMVKKLNVARSTENSRATWNGTNDLGALVASGVYFAKIESLVFSSILKIIYAR
jgi:S-formylglutathione hydrolase FrmB